MIASTAHYGCNISFAGNCQISHVSTCFLFAEYQADLSNMRPAVNRVLFWRQTENANFSRTGGLNARKIIIIAARAFQSLPKNSSFLAQQTTARENVILFFNATLERMPSSHVPISHASHSLTQNDRLHSPLWLQYFFRRKLSDFSREYLLPIR